MACIVFIWPWHRDSTLGKTREWILNQNNAPKTYPRTSETQVSPLKPSWDGGTELEAGPALGFWAQGREREVEKEGRWLY